MRALHCFAVMLVLGMRLAGQSTLTKEEVSQIGYEQRLGAKIPLGLQFLDDQGHQVKLGDYLGKTPTVLVLGYYKCPMLCGLISKGLSEAVGKVPLRIGRDYQVVQVSVDPREGPELAAAKKKSYLEGAAQPAEAAAGWHLLTGPGEASAQLAAVIGFQYRYDPKVNEYAHPAGLVILTPAGRVSQYLLGVSFDPDKLAAALRTAAEDRLGSPAERLWILCYHLLPVGGVYGPMAMAVLRVVAALFFVALVVTIIRLARRESIRGQGEGK